MSKILFQRWQVAFEPSFWATLGDYKLNEMKLNEGPLDLKVPYTQCNHSQVPGVVCFGPLSITRPHQTSSQSTFLDNKLFMHCQLYCMNTLERLSSINKSNLVEAACMDVYQSIRRGTALTDPSVLNRMIALVYCDLKQYKYHYLLGYPVLTPKDGFTFGVEGQVESLTQHFGKEQAHTVIQALEESVFEGSPSVFVIHLSDNNNNDIKVSVEKGLGANLEIKAGNSCLVILDASNSDRYPGWLLRNILSMITIMKSSIHKFRKNTELRDGQDYHHHSVDVISLRKRKGRLNADASTFFRVNIPNIHQIDRSDDNNDDDSAFDITLDFKFVGGWSESITTADLGNFMDPHKLATSAVDLNLQLMRWRAAPTLNTALISNTKCLLLGAGTLGCSVARCLLGWGVRKITFVDSGRVSYSNPVRQSLFEFEDCLHGGKPKATVAANAVHRIFPDVDVQGVELAIPMPGHPPSGLNQVEEMVKTVEKLQHLVDQHDVVFMLLDTRESRWLGTLMCAGSSPGAPKLALTAALGFESFLVMRHGAPVAQGDDLDMANIVRGGCYFCSDIVAPMNSTRDRTMDQQCTVARPGLSGIAGSLCVELMATVLQHPLGVNAPIGDPATYAEHEEPPLGRPPHMIRGQLTGFNQMCLSGESFDQCTACSPRVVAEYRARGADFVVQAVSESGFLEDLTGLKNLKKEMELAMHDLELSDEELNREGEEGWEEL